MLDVRAMQNLHGALKGKRAVILFTLKGFATTG